MSPTVMTESAQSRNYFLSVIADHVPKLKHDSIGDYQNIKLFMEVSLRSLSLSTLILLILRPRS